MERTIGIFAALLLCILMILVVVVPASPPDEAEGVCGATVTVDSGDTLRQIAETCNTTVDAILLANPEITNPNVIYVGQVIRIPNDVLEPALAVSFAPAVGPAGTLVEVVLRNFPPSSNATITFGAGQQIIVALPVQIDAAGSATAQIIVPDIEPLDEGYIISAFVTDAPEEVIVAAVPFILQTDGGSGE